MATLYPETPRAGCPTGEARVHAALKSLPDLWSVLHGVSWLSKDGRDGEADFVLVHPQHGLVVLEVKGGGVSVDRGVWYSTDRHNARHEIHDPFAQAVRSKHNLVRLISERFGRKLPSGHGVVFPDTQVNANLGVAAPPDLVCDRQGLTDAKVFVDGLCRRHELKADLSPRQADEIVQFCKPTVEVPPLDLLDTIENTERQLLELTDEQVALFFDLRGERRLLTIGRAGTGKTVIATELARRLSAEGFRTLLTCRSSHLAGDISARLREYRDSVTVSTFHALPDLINPAALKLGAIFAAPIDGSDEVEEEHESDGEPGALKLLPGPEPWKAQDRLLEIADAGAVFDAIIIDEGQDFPASWIETLQLLMTDPVGGPLYIFADPLQATLQKWIKPSGMPERFLRKNCRNTRAIAARASSLIGEENPVLGIEGSEPVGIALPPQPANVANENVWLWGALRPVVSELLRREAIEPSDVVVLSDSRQFVESVKYEKKVAGKYLVSLGGDGVAIESIGRFKGLEAQVVVLLLKADWSDAPTKIANVYTGMTRARAHLIVIAPQSTLDRVGLRILSPGDQ